nr:unnamed protein product [Callosobruchus analis]
MSENDADLTCLENPGAVAGGILDCDMKYCYIVREDYRDPKGKLKSLTRTCIDKPTFINDVIEDDTNRFYYRACKKDLCNGGNGRREVNTTAGAFGDKSTIYVPGIGSHSNAVTNIHSSIFVVIMTIMFMLLQI